MDPLFSVIVPPLRTSFPSESNRIPPDPLTPSLPEMVPPFITALEVVLLLYAKMIPPAYFLSLSFRLPVTHPLFIVKWV